MNIWDLVLIVSIGLVVALAWKHKPKSCHGVCAGCHMNCSKRKG